MFKSKQTYVATRGTLYSDIQYYNIDSGLQNLLFYDSQMMLDMKNTKILPPVNN